jgi:hypothetical protein
MTKGKWKLLALITAGLWAAGCALIPETAVETMPTTAVEEPAPLVSPTTAPLSPILRATLPKSDQILFAIPNSEPWTGKEGDPRPGWKGWGAETFAVAPDGSFWIADTAVDPDRLLHYSAQGDLLGQLSLHSLVVYPYDLAALPEVLWVLDISSGQPKVVQLSLEGDLLSSMDIPEEVFTKDGETISNGVFELLIGEGGELLANSINGYYELADAAGRTVTRPLDHISYNGHKYTVGNYDEASGRVPVFVDGSPLELPEDFFAAASPFVGFNPDGTFALAGYRQIGEAQLDYQVLYYDASGNPLLSARQAPQTFYKDWNHHLAFGPDGYVYQLLSNPDHSVEVVRLGFDRSLPPVTPVPQITPTPLTVLEPEEPVTTDEVQASKALLAFFTNLSAGNFAEAVPYFGGDVSEFPRAPLPGETDAAYWENLCEILWCLPIAEVTDMEKISEDEYIFYIVFMAPDGRRFEIGACCGGDPAATPPVWQFAYPVWRVEGEWKVMRGPLFTP